MMILPFLFFKLEYKSIYMLGYVHPNVVIRALQQMYKTPLYIDAKFSIKSNTQGLTKLTSVAK
jgi:hypothetical protein